MDGKQDEKERTGKKSETLIDSNKDIKQSDEKHNENQSKEVIERVVDINKTKKDTLENQEINLKRKAESIGNIVEADLPDEILELIKKMKETNKHLIKLILDEVGLEEFKKLIGATWEIEKGEGFLVADKSRRKTPGGVLFQLAKEKIGKTKFNFFVKQNNLVRKKQKS